MVVDLLNHCPIFDNINPIELEKYEEIFQKNEPIMKIETENQKRFQVMIK